MPLAEGVANLGDHCARTTCRVFAVPQAQRIEDPAEHTRKTQQADRQVTTVDALPCQHPFGPATQAALPGRQVIAIVETQQVEAVARKQPRSGSDLVETVDIQQQAEHPVTEAVGAGTQATVNHGRLVDAGPGQRRAHAACPSGLAAPWASVREAVISACQGTAAPNAVATSTPERMPSSWNP